MSSARRSSGSEDSILASLERGSPGARTHRSWQLIGASAAGVLTLMIAWLAYGNATSVRALPPSAVRQVSAPPADNGMPVEPVPSISIRAPEAAAIVDEPDASERPALVMLPRDEASRAQPAPEPAVAKAPDAPTLAKAAPPAKRSAARPQPAASKQLAKSAKSTRPPASRPLARAATAKKSKAAPSSSNTAQEMDSDVALISAIVAHSTRHAEERAQQEACQGKRCPPKSSTRP